MKVLVKEKIADSGIEKMRKAGLQVDLSYEMSREELLEKIKDYDGLIVRSGTQVDKELISRAKKLKIIGRAGIGVDNIDVEAATRRGVIVANAPQSNIVSAAEHTIALLLALARKIPQAQASLKSRKWERSKFEGVEICDKILGILGLGRVGTLVAQLAHGLKMKVIAYDPYVSKEKFQQLGVEPASTLKDLLQKSDFISINLPKTKETIGLLGEKEFEMMKDGVRIINTARGGIFKEEVLVKYLKKGKVAGAAIDVYEKEPCTESPLFDFDNVVVTPHLGASTLEAQDKAGIMIAEQIIAGLKGDVVTNAVNVPTVPPEVLEILKPYLLLAEILGKLYFRLSEKPSNQIEVTYSGELASKETRTLTIAILKGIFESIVAEPVTYVNAPYLAQERGIEVKESKTTTSREYVNLITLKGSGDELCLAGTIFGKGNQPRIVRIYDYEVDIIPSKYMLIVHNEDKPGMIGRLGTVLGNNNINIGRMQFGRKKVRGDAVSILSVDDPIPDKVLDEIKSLDGVSKAKFITL